MKPVREGQKVVVHLQATAGPGGLIPVAPGVYAHAAALIAMPDVDVRPHDGEPPVDEAPVRAVRRRAVEAERALATAREDHRAKGLELIEERARRHRRRAEDAERILREKRRVRHLALMVDTLRNLRDHADPDVTARVTAFLDILTDAGLDSCDAAYVERLYPDGDSDEFESGVTLWCVRRARHGTTDHLDQRGEEFTDRDVEISGVRF